MKSKILLVTLGLAMVGGQVTGQNSPSPVEKMNAPQLIDLTRRSPDAAAFQQTLVATFGREALEKGTAAIGEGPDFFWAVEAQSEPALFVNDRARYARFLRDELLADVQAQYNIRRDGYSRAIAGNSSGGICAFNAAWQQPDQFSRVLSHIGTYTSIQWKPGVLDGGNIYPFKVRKEPRKNLRVWLQDGSEDLENTHGSWPLQNIQLANSLKMAGYDFHFSFGNGSHSGAQGNAELPESLAWLWRDYDPAKTEQVYQMDPLEKDKPLFRVRIYNRE